MAHQEKGTHCCRIRLSSVDSIPATQETFLGKKLIVSWTQSAFETKPLHVLLYRAAQWLKTKWTFKGQISRRWWILILIHCHLMWSMPFVPTTTPKFWLWKTGGLPCCESEHLCHFCCRMNSAVLPHRREICAFKRTCAGRSSGSALCPDRRPRVCMRSHAPILHRKDGIENKNHS